MKFIKLLTAAYVGGALRHPHEGVLHVEDDDAQRLLDDEAAHDVSADFDAEQGEAAPVEHVTAQTDTAPQMTSEPHQSEVAPQAVEAEPVQSDDAEEAKPESKKPSRKAAAH